MTVEHLPIETSCITRFLLDREGRVCATLRSAKYCISPLPQGDLEIPCCIEIQMAPTMRNKELLGIYKLCVDTLYYEYYEVNIADSLESNKVSDKG